MIYAAPLLAVALFGIKNAIAGSNININVNINSDVVKKSIPFLIFLKKVPNFIGQIVISLAFLVFINYIYKSLPISFIDNLYYLKIFYFLNK